MSMREETDKIVLDLERPHFKALLSMLRRSNPRTPEEMFVYVTLVEGWGAEEFEDGAVGEDDEEEFDTEPDGDADYSNRFP